MTNTIWESNSWLCDKFSQEQINVICQCLFQWNDGERLDKLFQINPQLISYPYNNSTIILKAYLFTLYYTRHFDKFINVITNNNFESSHHSELVNLWYLAKYEQEEIIKVKKLVPVDKYRIRKKYPPPKSIWDGDELIYSFKKGDREILKEYYNINKYPNAEEKRNISRKTGLTMTQIANWFKNRRQREKGDVKNILFK